VKLRHAEAWTEARRAIARAYDDGLRGAGVVTPRALPHVRHVYHAYTIRASHRDTMTAGLAAAGIHASVHYPIPVHLQPAYRDPRYPEGSLPVAEQAAREVLSLPIYPELRSDQVEEVCAAVARLTSPVPAASLAPA
jgi:dTDP-4-amino-4,6-dideoxygalactose transaminase